MSNLILQKVITEEESNYLFDLDYRKKGYEVLLGYLARTNNKELYEEEKLIYFNICQEYQLVFNKLVSQYFGKEIVDYSKYNFFINYWDNIIFLKQLSDEVQSCQAK